MVGNVQVIQHLNFILGDELAAINQYATHAAMAENWGYERLSGYIMGRAKTEMKHAHAIIDRILFLQGLPDVEAHALHIGATVQDQLVKDAEAERTAIQAYNETIALCITVKDHGTKELLEGHLEDEEGHLNWIEAQQTLIAQMGLPAYLQTLVVGG